MAKQILIDESLAGYIIEQLNHQREDLILQREALDDQIEKLDEKIKSIVQQVQEEAQRDQKAVIQDIIQRTEEFRKQNPVRPQALSPAAVQQTKQTTKVLGDLLRLRLADIITLLQKHGIKSTSEIVDILCIERSIKKGSKDYDKVKANVCAMVSSAVKNGKLQSTYDTDTKKFIYSV